MTYLLQQAETAVVITTYLAVIIICTVFFYGS
jgi:hypothetical protein